MTNILVLGGGISGLTAARAINELGQECLLLERCPTVGGLTRTVEVGDFCFDYTGHFLHLSRYDTPADIPYAGLTNDTWQTVNRRSCCFVAGGMVTAPIQYHLGQLPPAVLQACVKSYEARAQTTAPHQQSTAPHQPTFRSFIVDGFGEYLADLFLIPQNEKTMAIKLECLSMGAVKRFFPPPNDALVRAGILGKSPADAGYNSRFWYPTTGGIGRLVTGLASGLKDVLTNQQVAAIDLRERTLRTVAGDSFSWDLLFSSIPLKALCTCSTDPELRHAAAQLSHSSTVSFNIGIRGALRPEFEGVHWIYVPDRSVVFYRVGFYSNISRGTSSPGNSSIYVEVGLSSNELTTTDLVKELQPKVLASLEELGWVDSRSIACVVINVIEFAYVHHTANRERLMASISERLRRSGVHLFGRYGLWDYTSMEDSMESARLTVQEVL